MKRTKRNKSVKKVNNCCFGLDQMIWGLAAFLMLTFAVISISVK